MLVNAFGMSTINLLYQCNKHFRSPCTHFPGSDVKTRQAGKGPASSTHSLLDLMLVVYRVILSNEFCISSERQTNVACIKTRYIAYKTEEMEDIYTAYTPYPIGNCSEDNHSPGPRAEDMGPGMNTSPGNELSI